MTRAIWFLRWHAARLMVHTALKIAPKGPARDLLVGHLNEYGREIMSALSKARSQGDETSCVECGGYNEAMKYAEVEGAKGIHVTVEALEARYRKVAEFNALSQPIPDKRGE